MGNYLGRYIKGRYGSRRGFVRTYWHKILYRLGCYNRYRKINWRNIDRVVFVCKGNICRSAYAEAVARSQGLCVISCGLNAIVGASANAAAIGVAASRGVDLKEHKTMPVMYVVLKSTDLLVAMEPWQADYLFKNLKREHDITLLGLWLPTLRPHVQDPYGMSAKYFNNCFEYIDNSVYEITKKIKKN